MYNDMYGLRYVTHKTIYYWYIHAHVYSVYMYIAECIKLYIHEQYALFINYSMMHSTQYCYWVNIHVVVDTSILRLVVDVTESDVLLVTVGNTLT